MKSDIWIAAVVCVMSGCRDGGGSGADAGPGTRLLAGRQWDPATCTPFSPSEALGGTCTDEDLIEWHECTTDACQDEYEACYGAGFRSGEYTGVCKPFIDCAQRCDCYDTDCVAACPIPQDCLDCFDGVSCGQECSPSCIAFGPRAGKTCRDTLACCPGLPNESLQSECVNGVANVQDEPDGDRVCAGFYGLYSVISSTCD